MKILVDADACPVKEIIVAEAKKRKLPVRMFIDTSHELHDGYSSVTVVDKGRDSADFALIAQAARGDLVVTQDYGVAAMALAKGALALNQNGLIYTDGNIGALLDERAFSQKIRRAGRHAGVKTGNMAKRSREEDRLFREALLRLLDAAAAGGQSGR